jgi:RNA polymerase sigma-70 factor (ECF subfamily)
MTDAEFCELHDAYAVRLWAYVFRATGDASSAEDIVQEAFYRVLTARRLNNVSEQHRRRYLFTVATNLIRRRSRLRAEIPYDDAAGLEQPPSGVDQRLDVERALGSLTAVERQSLWLSHVEGWTHREIAAMMGYREGSLRHLISRAKRRFIAAFVERNSSDSESQ